MYALAGTDVAVAILFRVDGNPVIPDAGTVSYTVRDNAGVAIAGQVDVPVTTNGSTTQKTISVPSDANVITGRIEKRTVVVTWQAGGIPHQDRFSYFLTEWLDYTATPADVRSLLGVNYSELPDADIDLVKAYLAIENDVGQDDWGVLFSTGDYRQVAANEALACRAALDVLPSLMTRIAQIEADGLASFQRPSITDVETLRADLTDRYNNALNLVTNAVAVTESLMVFSQPVDPVTGA